MEFFHSFFHSKSLKSGVFNIYSISQFGLATSLVFDSNMPINPILE